MFYIKSSFVLFFIAFYIELSVFEGEYSIAVSTPKEIWLIFLEIFLSISSSFEIFTIADRRITANSHGIGILTKSLNTFWHEPIFLFTEYL